MQVEVKADRGVEDHEAFTTQVRGVVEDVLGRFRTHIAQVNVHFSKENLRQVGQSDRRCLLEAHLEDRQAVAVTHEASTPEEAVRGAAEKMTNLIESCFVPRSEGPSRT